MPNRSSSNNNPGSPDLSTDAKIVSEEEEEERGNQAFVIDEIC